MIKRTAALILCLVLAVPAFCFGAEFTDISDEKTAQAAAVLQSMGVVEGTGKGFEPGKNLTRAQACKLIVHLMGLQSQVDGSSRKTIFSDVLPDAWYTGYVNLAYSKGVIMGYGNGRFGPDDTVTYGQLATMVLRLLGYESSDIGSIWPNDYTAMCEELELSEDLGLDPEGAISRGNTAVMLCRLLTEETKTGKIFYKTISGIAEEHSAVILDVSAENGGVKDKLMAYALDGSGVTYFDQQLQVSKALEGLQGTVLCDAAGKVCGFIPESTEFTDIVIDKADSGSVTAKGGKKYRLQTSVTIVAGEESYSFSGNGSARLNSQAGKEARLYFGSDDAVTYIVVSKTASSASDIAVASTSSAAESLARALGITGKTYKITKNGKPVEADSLALYDVGYYDSGTDTLRTSDYRISGFIEAADPGIANAETITVCGCTLSVLKCAQDDMEGLTLGSKAVFLLTDDLKVAAVRPSDFECEMMGVLSSDGRSVTLCSSGLQLKASQIKSEEKTAGSVVKVTCPDYSDIKCSAVTGSAAPGSLSIEDRTVGDIELSADCRIYERAAEGAYVYSLDGIQGEASDSLDDLGRTGTLNKNYIGYYHTNGAGKIDILVLDDVTGNCYTYGKAVRYTDNAGINLGSGSMSAYNDAVAVVNGNGTSQKAIDTSKVDETYVGLAFGTTSSGNAVVKKAVCLTKITQNDTSNYFCDNDCWYVIHGTTEYRIADDVQIYYNSVGRWTSGTDSMASLLTDCSSFTLYCDKAADMGGKIRVITAE